MVVIRLGPNAVRSGISATRIDPDGVQIPSCQPFLIAHLSLFIRTFRVLYIPFLYDPVPVHFGDRHGRTNRHCQPPKLWTGVRGEALHVQTGFHPSEPR